MYAGWPTGWVQFCLLKSVRPSDSVPVAAATTGNNNRHTNVGYIIVINVLDATAVLVLPRNFRNSACSLLFANLSDRQVYFGC